MTDKNIQESQGFDRTHAFLLIVHNDPLMFTRLARHLQRYGAIYVHVDAKEDIKQYQHLVPDAIYMEERTNVKWGSWEIVDVSVRLMNLALANSSTERLTLLSGVHYPLITPSQMKSDSRVRGDIIESRPAPNQPDGSKSEKEYERRWVRLLRPNSQAHMVAQFLVNRVWYLGRPPKWRNVAPLTGMRAGSGWWSLTRPTSEYMVRRIQNGGPLIEYFKKIMVADEKIFATLFGELTQLQCQDGTTYVSWRSRSAHPDPLQLSDLIEAQAEGKFWFARKFNSQNTELLDYLDETLDQG